MDVSAGWDIVVIGSGPGGEGAALRAAKAGLRVALIDEKPQVGGNCTHYATIPSKALRHQVRQVLRQRRNPVVHAVSEMPDIDWPRLVYRMQDVIRAQVTVRSGFYLRNRVRVFNGRARLRSSREVEISGSEGRNWLLETDRIILATGTRPYRPPDVDFPHPRVYDSDTLLSMEHSPRNVLI